MPTPVRFVIALVLSGIVGAAAYRRGSLSLSGWLGAVLVGTLTTGIGGWDWGALVIVFFVSSSALSRFGARRKALLASAYWEKGDRRDIGQVLANGGLVTLVACLAWLWPSSAWWPAAVGALATATGDTWATEIGALSRSAPRLITSGRQVPAGTSGGVTLLGSAAALGGALLIGVAASVLGVVLGRSLQPWIVVCALAGGAAGVAVDSLLGATVQAIRWCPRCHTETERHVHGCGMRTERLRGWRWLRNDGVNALATAAGALVAAAVAAI